MFSRLAPKYLQHLLDVYTARARLIDHCARQLTYLYNMKSHGLRLISVCGSKLWKELPSELRAIESITNFKAKLNTRLFKAYFT